MTDPIITGAALKAAEMLAPEIVKNGARRIGQQIVGTPAERGMRDVYERAIAGLLVNVGEAAEEHLDPEAMKVGESVLGGLCYDEEAASILLNVALRPGPIPIEDLRERAASLDYEPDTLPFAFDDAMWILAERVYQEFVFEASKENSRIQPLVNAELLASVREHHQSLMEASTAEEGNLLPPPPGLVLGRTDELNRARRMLGVFDQEADRAGAADNPTKVVTVHGWPGLGKSAFISTLCRSQEVLDHFSGGVIFIPVGLSPNVRRLAEEVSVALGVPTPPGTTLNALRGRISDVLSQRSVLIVFDEVWEEGHVAPLLLAEGGSAVLVATRRLDIATRLSTATEGTLRLGLLSEEDSLQLIASRAPNFVAKNEDACRELVRALDGLPLALRVAADLLRVEVDAGFDVSGLLGELTEAALLDEEAPYDAGYDAEDGAEEAAMTVRVLLQKSVERLDEDTVKRFAQLGVLPAKPLSFDLWAAQEVWHATGEDLDVESEAWKEEQELTRRTLSSLARRGLLESADVGIDPLAVKLDLRLKRPERFWMHALIAAFAFETLEHTEGDDGVRQAQQRRLEHYRQVVAAANVAALEGGETQYFGVFILSQELPNIRAAHGWARARSADDSWALKYLSRLPAEGRRVLSERLGPGEFMDWMELAEKAARGTGDEEEARLHRDAMGAALLRKGQLRESLMYCEESIETARLNKDRIAEGTALANLASIRNSMGQHKTALNLARRAEKVLKNSDAPDAELGAIGQQAGALEGLGKFAKAEIRYKARRDLAWDVGELSSYARALKGIAGIKRERPEEQAEARQLYEEAAQVFWDLREYDSYRGALNSLGVLELKAKNLDAAEDVFQRALSAAVDGDHKGDQARSKMNLGLCYQDRGTQHGHEAAEIKYREALPLAKEWDEPDLIGDVLFNLAQLLYYYVGSLQDAREEAVSAAEAYGRAGSAKETWVMDLIGQIDNAAE